MLKRLKTILMGVIICTLAVHSQTSTLDAVQKKHLSKPQDEKAYFEYSKMVSQIPLIDTKNFSIAEGRSKYADFLKTLDSIDCSTKKKKINCSKEVIATIRGYDIVGITIGDVKRKPVIFLYNQHGNEYNAVHTLRELTKYLTTSQDDQVKYLLKHVAFYIIPTAAAWNYDNNKYLLENGVNLNRLWDNNWEKTTDTTKGTNGPWSEPEVVVVRDKIIEWKPFLLIDMHSSRKPGLNITSPDWKPLIMAIHDSTKDIPLNPTQYWTGYKGPTGTGWGHLQTARDGNPTIATTFETDGGEDRAESLNYGINTLYRLFYMATKLRVQ